MFPQPLQPPLLWKPFCVSNHFCCLSPDPFCSCYIILKRIDQRGAHHSRQVCSTDLCAGTIMLSAIFLMSFFPEFSSDICWWLFKTSRVLLTVGAAVPFSSGPNPFRTSTVLPLLLFLYSTGLCLPAHPYPGKVFHLCPRPTQGNLWHLQFLLLLILRSIKSALHGTRSIRIPVISGTT